MAVTFITGQDLNTLLTEGDYYYDDTCTNTPYGYSAGLISVLVANNGTNDILIIQTVKGLRNYRDKTLHTVERFVFPQELLAGLNAFSTWITKLPREVNKETDALVSIAEENGNV